MATVCPPGHDAAAIRLFTSSAAATAREAESNSTTALSPSPCNLETSPPWAAAADDTNSAIRPSAATPA